MKTRAASFYVTVRDGAKTGSLLGPFATHDEALANVARAKELAEKNDPFSVFYAFGTAGVTGDRQPTTVFGV